MISTEQAARILTGKLVFVLDDEPTTLVTIRETLEQFGANLILADTPSVMLKLLAFNKPDLLISDVMMPEFDGFELFAKMREMDLNRTTPTLFLTGISQEEEDWRFTKGEGNTRLIAKPVHMERLLDAIEELLTEE